jgi:hypothetical protein
VDAPTPSKVKVAQSGAIHGIVRREDFAMNQNVRKRIKERDKRYGMIKRKGF